MVDETFVESLRLDIARAEAAAARARAPFDLHLGDLLREARAQQTEEEFRAWIRRHFRRLSVQEANRCMALSEAFDAFQKGGPR